MAANGCKWCAIGQCWGCRFSGKGGGKGKQNSATPQKVAVAAQKQPKKAAPAQTPVKKELPKDANALLAQMVTLFQETFMQSGARSSTPWKGKLFEALKKNGIDEKPNYVAMANIGGEGFLGTVTVNGQSFTSEEPVKSKREAESNAAKAAFKVLYPDQFSQLSEGDAGWMMGMLPAVKGQKRKEPPTDLPAKSKLMSGIQLMVRNANNRCLTKEDIVYATTENEGPPKTYMSTVTITEYEGGKSFSGDWCESKMKAENSAATAAYDAMGDMLGALQEEHAAKKKEKNKAQLAALVERTAAKKEAKKLEAQAAATA
eukprot:TRINITY_DN224_c0_g1_i1.p1 TRINITY_DN224_c0_g1~~TRINITY_DN224_c0_g1_i1.p1  ORF type:complete len:316 (-),score=84.34 TRINITY_DN224_c0_g1_i1:179-1126(-)